MHIMQLLFKIKLAKWWQSQIKWDRKIKVENNSQKKKKENNSLLTSPVLATSITRKKEVFSQWQHKV